MDGIGGLDAKLLIAGYCQLWLDPIGSLIRPEFFFNSYYVNRGSWIAEMPYGSDFGPLGPASPSYSAGLEFELTGMAQSVELA